MRQYPRDILDVLGFIVVLFVVIPIMAVLLFVLAPVVYLLDHWEDRKYRNWTPAKFVCHAKFNLIDLV